LPGGNSANTEEHWASFAQRDLPHIILELNDRFDSRQGAVAGIEHVAREIGDLLVQ